MGSSLILIFAVFSLFSPSYQKNVKIEKVSTCNGKQGQLTDISGLETVEGTSGWGLTGTAELLRNLPNNVTVSGSIYKHLIRWIPVVPVPKMSACDFLRKKLFVYEILRKNSNLPSKCPVKKSTFKFRDVKLDPTEIPWYIPSGCTRIDFKLNLGKKTIACYRVIMNVVNGEVPKKFKCV
ncbi:hypothetical protein GE061_010261 [Apolygus lucorum]|uniref:MD-2-related lipid-recognition domain-containing protein n=1 Tax=Apolygus lucorum TaxID=248454 RepID=A0A8S9Y587_APOLU|nr:hypothetical protein GE061_010261 [Apolygus lucorum]